MNPETLDNELLSLAHDIIVTISRFSEILDTAKVEQFVDFIAKMKGIALNGMQRTAILRRLHALVCG